jgi:hypothetical protein
MIKFRDSESESSPTPSGWGKTNRNRSITVLPESSQHSCQDHREWIFAKIRSFVLKEVKMEPDWFHQWSWVWIESVRSTFGVIIFSVTLCMHGHTRCTAHHSIYVYVYMCDINCMCVGAPPDEGLQKRDTFPWPFVWPVRLDMTDH